jgi:hypothetical protein
MLSILSIIIITGFIYLDGIKIVKNTVVPYYDKGRKLNSLVRTQYSNIFVVLTICLLSIKSFVYQCMAETR